VGAIWGGNFLAKVVGDCAHHSSAIRDCWVWEYLCFRRLILRWRLGVVQVFYNVKQEAKDESNG
jgi:hypothetical protein